LEPIDNAFLTKGAYPAVYEPTYAGATSFFRRPYTRDLSGFQLAVGGFPLDLATSNRPGARFGPRAIRAESTNIAWGPPYGWGFDPFAVIAAADYGDCHFDFAKPASIQNAMRAHAAEIVGQGACLLALGGDHFVTYPILQATAARQGPLALLHFDAHRDCNACDPGDINHGTMFWAAAKEGLVDPGRSIQVGIRTAEGQDLGYEILDAPALSRITAEEAAARIKARLGDAKVYLSFDIDCLDPAFAPGTGTPVTGGISSLYALEILRALRGIELIGMDVVEVAPPYDQSGATALAAASLAHEMIALYAWRHRG